MIKTYTIVIDTGIDRDSSDIGLVGGVYTWVTGGEHILIDGIANLPVGVDFRSMGGLSKNTKTTISIIGGLYSKIQAISPIQSKRIKIYDGPDEIYTGVITSIDAEGSQSVLNIYNEDKTRLVATNKEALVFGTGEIVGGVIGTSGDIENIVGKPFLWRGVNTNTDGNMYPIDLVVYGATETNVNSLLSVHSQINFRISNSDNVYAVGQYGIYKIIESIISIPGEYIILKIGSGTTLNSVEDEVGEVGTIIWSNEIYEAGPGGVISVDGVVLDDANSNVVPYKNGYALDAYDGEVTTWLTEGVDYSVAIDTEHKNSGLMDSWGSKTKTYNGLYFRTEGEENPDWGNTDITGDIAYISNRDDFGDQLARINYGSGVNNIYLACGYTLEMHGYKYTADNLYLVVDFDEDYLDMGSKYFQEIWVTTIDKNGSVIATKKIGDHAIIGYDETRRTLIAPKKYNSSIANIYSPQLNRLPANIGELTSSPMLEISDMLYDAGGDLYYDGVTICIAASRSSVGGIFERNAKLHIRQLGLLEGYDVGREGLADVTIPVDNVGVNSTISTAYADIIARQNLNSTNEQPPASGWGTDKIAIVDSDYIEPCSINGNLHGVLKNSTTGAIKKEISRCVPAVSCYTADGREKLVPIGKWGSNPTLIDYHDIRGAISITAINIDSIYTDISFVFGGDLVLKITNSSADTYDASYVIDSVGLGESMRSALWGMAHDVYLHYGTTNASKELQYPLVRDTSGVYRIITAIYGDMGYTESGVHSRVTATYTANNRAPLSIGESVEFAAPNITGIGIVTGVSRSITGASTDYEVQAIDTTTGVISILEHGTGGSDSSILEHGTDGSDENIFEVGL